MAIAAMTATGVQALTGVVVDENGAAIANARVEIVGGRSSVATDAQGRFALDEKSAEELHVVAPGFGHRVVHLEETTGELRIVMVPSVIEQVDVIGLPLHASVIESSLPIAVLSGEELRKRQAATLGDSLESEVGVHTSFHGGVASTPVIRGLSGPRVLIAQNGLDVSDVSRVGPDHAVASEVSTVQQVEILRGPATLFFGSGAIGGVVNVVDQRVPTDAETRGEWLAQHDSVNRQKLLSFNVNSGGGNVGLHADGFWRDAADYDIPVAADADAPQSGDFSVANSAEESTGATLGGSYLADDGYVGISLGRLDRQYGIPGHSHGGEEGEEEVYADLEQDRYQLLSEWNLDHPWLRAVNTRAAYTDYTHAEIEEGVVGTTFSNKTAELRVDLLHQDFAGWRGGINLHYKQSKIAAEGAEAFTPPSKAQTFAAAFIEERHFGDVLLQLGARVERVELSADDLLLPHLQAHRHGEEEGDHDEGDAATRVFAVEQEFTPISISAGAVWDFRPGYNVGLALSRSQRAPSAAELMSFGPHIGAGTYEVGALFTLQATGESEFDLNRAALDLETANNIDVTFRKHEGDLGIIINAFYNRIDDYYYQQSTGIFAESADDHGHDHGGDAHTDELPVYLFASDDVELLGFEAQAIWQINSQFKTTAFSDYVRAELESGEYLPRQSPHRFGLALDYEWQRLSANIDWMRYQRQDNVAPRESASAGYNMLDATITYHWRWLANDLALYVKGENLTDTEARVHTSFLKDLAPRPGRNFSIGIRGNF